MLVCLIQFKISKTVRGTSINCIFFKIRLNCNKMFRQLIRALEPVRNKLSRAVAGATDGGASGSGGNAFAHNSQTKEQKLSSILKKTLPGITYISIEDISGGCGAMYEISIEAKEFRGLSTVKQHRMVTDTLKREIAEMHGIRIHTTPTKPDEK